MHGEMNAYRDLVGKPKLKRPLGSWRIILKWMSQKYDGVLWTGFILLMIGTSGGLF
jgi:hypothetical protein